MLNRDLDVLYRDLYIVVRDLDIVIRDLDLLIYSNSRSRIVFLIYYFFSMSLIRFRTIGSNFSKFMF